MMRIVILGSLVWMLWVDPAAAGPVAGLVAAGKAFLATKIGSFVATIALNVGSSLIAQRLRKKPRQPGLQNQFRGRGGSEPGSFVLGRVAVKGHQTYHNSSGRNNKWYHEVIELCDLPGASLERLIIDGEYSELGGDYVKDGVNYGRIILSKNKDHDSHRGFIQFYNGTQTTADPMLVHFFNFDARRWTPNHKLTGVCYAVLTYYQDRKRYPRGVPENSYEMMSIPVYDPRQDSSVGGSGAQRWSEPSTWSQSDNLVVLIYNILLGIAVPGGDVWGGDCDLEDLPLANWVAAMNTCDLDVGGRRKYTGGIEVRWTDEPREIIEQLLAGCNGQISPRGGVYRVQVDAPETALVAITDDDLVVSEPIELEQFPGFEGTFNGGTVVHPDPAQLWNSSAPHTVTNPDLEARDGAQRLFDLQLPVVYDAGQAKQVLNAAINDHRRFRRHVGTLPPDLFWLDTLNTFAWTSESEGYTNKLFEISETAFDLSTFNTERSIRERDPNDFPILNDLEIGPPAGVTTPILRLDAGVTGFAFDPLIITVEDGPARPAFRLSWDAEDLDGNIAGIAFELRLVGSEMNAKSGTTADIAAGQLILSGGLIPNALYEARPKALSDTRETLWDNWVTARAPNVGLGSDDFWARLDAQSQEMFDRARAVQVAALERTEESALQDMVREFLQDEENRTEIIETRNEQRVAIKSLSATIEQDYVTVVTLDTALAQAREEVTAEIGDSVSSGVSQVSNALATLDQAFADYVTTTGTTLNSQTASISSIQTSQNGVLAQWGIKVNNNGVVSGVALTSDLINGQPTTDLVFDVDSLRVGRSDGAGGFKAPFVIENGKLYARELFVDQARIEGELRASLINIDGVTLRRDGDALAIGFDGIDTIHLRNNAATTLIFGAVTSSQDNVGRFNPNFVEFITPAPWINSQGLPVTVSMLLEGDISGFFGEHDYWRITRGTDVIAQGSFTNDEPGDVRFTESVAFCWPNPMATQVKWSLEVRAGQQSKGLQNLNGSMAVQVLEK